MALLLGAPAGWRAVAALPFNRNRRNWRPNSRRRKRKNPMQEQLMVQVGRATLTGYQDYAVGPEDLLDVTFMDADDLDREVRVNGQGEVSLPLVGPVKVSGLSPQAIEKRLAQLYREGDLSRNRKFQSRSRNIAISG